MRILIPVLLAVTAAAVEVPATVVRVVDGDTIIAKVGEIEERVRLLWIDTPESKGNAHGEAMPEGTAAKEFLEGLMRPGDGVVLWGPKVELERDVYKRILALIKVGISTPGEQSWLGFKAAQVEIIKSGWSPYWRKYGEAPEPWNEELLKAHAEAEGAKAGAWGTAEKWMRDKANERTGAK